jgi:hypothetical protein
MIKCLDIDDNMDSNLYSLCPICILYLVVKIPLSLTTLFYRMKYKHMLKWYNNLGLIHGTWIGATDKAKEGEWRWSSSGRLLTYSAWSNEQPDNWRGNEDCGHLFEYKGKLLWNDSPCSSKIQTLCKKKA